jgi:hypothetical protein
LGLVLKSPWNEESLKIPGKGEGKAHACVMASFQQFQHTTYAQIIYTQYFPTQLMAEISRLDHSVRRLRNQVFSKTWPLDQELLQIAATSPLHQFLANPSGQYGYIYLTQFVRALSEKHFGRPFQDLNVMDWGCGKGHVSKLIRDLGPKRLKTVEQL